MRIVRINGSVKRPVISKDGDTHRPRTPRSLKKPHRWDIRYVFVEACNKAGLEDLHVHDLRHLGPPILLAQGVPDSIVAKVTGPGSAALKRYQHLSESLRRQTVDLIASVLSVPFTDTCSHTVPFEHQGRDLKNGCKTKKQKRLNGRPERTRTVDLYRVKVAL